MERIPNPELDRIILNHLSDLYKLKEKRDKIHLSTLVSCLTRSFFDRMQDIEPTDRELMLFSLGFALQDVLTPQEATLPVFWKDGVVFSPDFFLPYGKEYCEIKTTRASLKKNKIALPEAWVEYIMGGCYIRDILQYQLSSLHILGSYNPPFPELYSETLVFTQEELQSNWDRLMERKVVFEKALADNQPPTPFQFCKEWECKNCRHKIQCEALTMLAQIEERKNEADTNSK